ncbi:MAG: hypothetical protein GKR95_25795 [Gammaproteobacteria bacterium]|nr:hypothetical protein [Gammaproteobacteria bacterium]
MNALKNICSRQMLLLAPILLCFVAPVLAGSARPVPAPLVGGFGPLGLAILAVGYVGYRVFKHFKNR